MTMFHFWCVFGAFLTILELFIPGLVVVFVGLGSLTVALLLHLEVITSLAHQLIVFFSASMVYLFTLRFLFLRFVPREISKENIDEDDFVFGKEALVIEDININSMGRIKHSGTTWQAKLHEEEEVPLKKGDIAIIVGRENITWIVKKK